MKTRKKKLCLSNDNILIFHSSIPMPNFSFFILPRFIGIPLEKGNSSFSFLLFTFFIFNFITPQFTTIPSIRRDK